MTEKQAEKLDKLNSKVDRLLGSLQGNGGKGMAQQLAENMQGLSGLQLRMEHAQTQEGCAAVVKTCTEARKEQIVEAVEVALSKHKRSRWLLVKDILLGLLSSSVLAALIAGLIEMAKTGKP